MKAISYNNLCQIADKDLNGSTEQNLHILHFDPDDNIILLSSDPEANILLLIPAGKKFQVDFKKLLSELIKEYDLNNLDKKTITMIPYQTDNSLSVKYSLTKP